MGRLELRADFLTAGHWTLLAVIGTWHLPCPSLVFRANEDKGHGPHSPGNKSEHASCDIMRYTVQTSFLKAVVLREGPRVLGACADKRRDGIPKAEGEPRPGEVG